MLYNFVYNLIRKVYSNVRKITLTMISCVSIIGNCVTAAGVEAKVTGSILEKVPMISLLDEIKRRVESENFKGFRTWERDQLENLLSTREVGERCISYALPRASDEELVSEFVRRLDDPPWGCGNEKIQKLLLNEPRFLKYYAPR